MMISIEENKQIARRIFEEVLNRGDWGVADQLVLDCYRHHPAPQGLAAGVGGFCAILQMYRTGFPDLQTVVEDVIGEGDLVAVRFSGRGTHGGEFMGIVPTGREIRATGMAWFRFEDGKVAEEWSELNALEILLQIGALPGLPE
jgi:predicted ester cyclase